MKEFGQPTFFITYLEVSFFLRGADVRDCGADSQSRKVLMRMRIALFTSPTLSASLSSASSHSHRVYLHEWLKVGRVCSQTQYYEESYLTLTQLLL